MDDILIYSNTKNEHVKYIKMVLDKLRRKNLKIKIKKCKFHIQKITFLDYVIISKNIQMETTKIDNV